VQETDQQEKECHWHNVVTNVLENIRLRARNMKINKVAPKLFHLFYLLVF